MKIENDKVENVEIIKDIILKDCPFCGGSAEKYETVVGSGYAKATEVGIKCSECNLSVGGEIWPDPSHTLEKIMERKIEYWNTRITI